MRIHLAIPGLLGPFPRATTGAWRCPELPNLTVLLSQADKLASTNGWDDLLFSLFGHESPDAADQPVAAVCRLADGLDPDRAFWLRAAPVHLRPDRDRVLLFDSARFDLPADEARDLAATVAAFFAEDGCDLQYTTPDRWYLRLDTEPRLRTQPLDEVVGRNIEAYLPRGDDAGAWRARLTEVQMLLHMHPVNERREERGEPAINGLWIWGGGRLPEGGAARFRRVYADDCVSTGLAQLCGAPVEAFPDDFEALGPQGSEGEVLVVAGEVYRSILDADMDAWAAAVRQLEDAWLAPLRWAIRRGRVASLALYPAYGPAYVTNGSPLRRLFRRVRPLESFFVEAVAETAPAAFGASS